MPPTREAIQHAYTVLHSLDSIAVRFSLSKLGMTDADFERAKLEAQSALDAVSFLEAFGVVAHARETLVSLGWQPPQGGRAA